MYDFTLSEEQRSLKELVRKFAEKEIRPIVAEADAIQDPRKTWSLVGSVIKKGLQLGFGKIMIPEKYGGAGGGIIELEILTEELATVDHGIAMSFTLNAVLPLMICSFGTEEQINKWVSPSVQDESGKYIWAMSTTEPSGGSEVFCPLPDPVLGVHVTATRDGEGYRLNGQKSWTTNAGRAENYIVLARTDRNKPNLEGCSLFIYSQDAPGISFGKIEDKMGNRTIQSGEIYFDAMWIPKENLLGKEGEGFPLCIEFSKRNAVAGTTGAAIGLAKAAFNDALKYSRQRVIWGRPLIEHPAVAKKLVGMKMKIETCKAIVEKSMWALENPSSAPGLNKMASLAKIYATTMLPEVTSDAMYLFGGYGYSREYPLERYMRDSLASRIFEGNNDMLEVFIARDLEPIV